MKAKIIEGRCYYNPFREMTFVIKKINGDECLCMNEDKSQTFWSKKELIDFLQNSIDKKLKNWEWNTENWKYIQQNDPCNILDELGKDITDNIPSEWIDSKYIWFMKLPNSSKGSIARKLYCCYMESKGFDVSKNNNDEYERYPIVDGRKKCIKSACMKMYEVNTFNNIRQFQEWDDIVFICIFPNHVEFYEIDKELFIAYLKENPSQIIWAGGKEKKERLNSDINKNDYFQWAINYPMPEDALTKIV